VRRQQGPLPIMVLDRQIVSCATDAQGYPTRIITRLSDSSYACGRSALESVLRDGEVDVYGSRDLGVQHKSTALALGLLTAREKTAATLLQNTTTFAGQTTAAAAKWDTANGDPLADITKLTTAVRKRTGVPARRQRVLLPADAYDAFCAHPKVREVASRFSIAAPTALPMIFPETTAAAILGVGSVVIASAVYDTANQAKSPALSDLWDRTIVAAFVPSGDAALDPVALGFDLVWDAAGVTAPESLATGISVNAALAFELDAYRDERAEGTVVRVKAYDQMLITNKWACQLLTTVL
jgi:hypothetical protein